ncbi:MAG: hypothetical protein V1796_08515 [Pseudomonadota bacterium]
MFVTSRLVMEDGKIFPCGAVVVGPNPNLDEAIKTLDGAKTGNVAQKQSRPLTL